jgi:cyclopropane-fatty-acyl-phospholipid synthase
MTTNTQFARDEHSRMPAAARILCALLARMELGALELTTPAGGKMAFGPGGAVAPGLSHAPAVLQISNWSTASAVLKGGDVGFAEAYMDGLWDTPDLTQLLTVLAANHAALERAFYGHVLTRALLRLRHLLQANTRRGAQRNIKAHYDLGNEFYALWLDSTMTYSAAWFGGDRTRTLADAQTAKYERLLGELALAPGATVLEVGCGWGGFAEVTARAGHRVRGISLSPAQTAYAQERLAREGLDGNAELAITDYRDQRGCFDGVASIEMFEAVGERWWPTYFRTVRDLLAPGARACIQTITIDEARFARYRTQSDFIQQYIFPGGMLASSTRLVALAAEAGLTLVRMAEFGRDYAETLKRWLAAFDERVVAVRSLGYDARFIRCWRFYLAYCAAGFDTGTTDVAQYTFARA